MTTNLYYYEFAPNVPLEDLENSLQLALLATECLHGVAQTRLDVTIYFDRAQRACVIDAETQVGRDLHKLFAGFLRLEFGADAFRAARVHVQITFSAQETAA